MSGHDNDTTERDFALRAAAYLREQGLTDDEVAKALKMELGLEESDVDDVVATTVAA